MNYFEIVFESPPCYSCAAIFYCFCCYSGKRLECFQVTYFMIFKPSLSPLQFFLILTLTTCQLLHSSQVWKLCYHPAVSRVRSHLFGQEIIMSCFLCFCFFFLVHTFFFFPPHKRMLLIKICNRPLSNWSPGSGQVSAHNNTLAIASFNHKPNMKRSARLGFLSFLPGVVCACSSRPRESSFIRRLFIRLLINLITCSCACCLAEPPFTLHPEPVLNHSPLLHSHISRSHNYVVNPWTTSKTSNILPNRVRQIKAWLFADYSHRKEPYFQISVISNVKLQDKFQICCTRSKKKKKKKPSSHLTAGSRSESKS